MLTKCAVARSIPHFEKRKPKKNYLASKCRNKMEASELVSYLEPTVTIFESAKPPPIRITTPQAHFDSATDQGKRGRFKRARASLPINFSCCLIIISHLKRIT